MSDNRPHLDLSDIPLDMLYIDGDWCAPETDRKITIISPDTEEAVAQVAEAVKADADKAISAARRAFDRAEWSGLSYADRAEWLRKLSAELQTHSDTIALAWSEQIGVPYHGLAKIAAPSLAKSLDQYIELAADFAFEAQQQIQAAGAGFLVHEPVGVVLAIAPWNVPLNTLLHKVGPALLAGCTVIMKPSPQTPIEAYIVAQCAHEIGLPKGVLNLICAERDVSDYLVNKPDVDKVAFTGSVAAGQRIASVCGERIARCSLELGGKSAAIILDDYDLDKAAGILVNQICSLSGQNCAALSRVLVSSDRHDLLVAKMKKVAEQIKIGHTYDQGTQLGPIAMKRQLERIEVLIGQGVDEGAALVTGGRRPPNITKGYFIEPTIFANVKRDMAIAQEEIFGPVICVMPYDSLDQAISIANDSDFGLAGAVFTDDLEQAYSVARQMRTGTVGHNGPRADFSIGFGGFKKSGIGREGGSQGLRAYLEPKTLLLEGIPNALLKSVKIG